MSKPESTSQDKKGKEHENNHAQTKPATARLALQTGGGNQL